MINTGMDELPDEYKGVPLMDYARDLSLFDELEPHEIAYVRAIFMCKAMDEYEYVVRRSSMKTAKFIIEKIMAK